MGLYHVELVTYKTKGFSSPISPIDKNDFTSSSIKDMTGVTSFSKPETLKSFSTPGCSHYPYHHLLTCHDSPSIIMLMHDSCFPLPLQPPKSRLLHPEAWIVTIISPAHFPWPPIHFITSLLGVLTPSIFPSSMASCLHSSTDPLPHEAFPRCEEASLESSPFCTCRWFSLSSLLCQHIDSCPHLSGLWHY